MVTSLPAAFFTVTLSGKVKAVDVRLSSDTGLPTDVTGNAERGMTSIRFCAALMAKADLDAL